MKNTAASVRARLTNLSRAEGVSLDFMIERFAIGRLLWRLSQSPDAHRFILKAFLRQSFLIGPSQTPKHGTLRPAGLNFHHEH